MRPLLAGFMVDASERVRLGAYDEARQVTVDANGRPVPLKPKTLTGSLEDPDDTFARGMDTQTEELTTLPGDAITGVLTF